MADAAPLHPATEQLVAPAERDILLQLFAAGKISRNQLLAGRRWQSQMDGAAIQPLRSIDWSSPVSRASYQPHGDLTEKQFEAMRWRRAFLEFTGPAAARFLDLALGVDQSRAEIARALEIPPPAVDLILVELLAVIPSVKPNV